jgi:hypothetical protein
MFAYLRILIIISLGCNIFSFLNKYQSSFKKTDKKTQHAFIGDQRAGHSPRFLLSVQTRAIQNLPKPSPRRRHGPGPAARRASRRRRSAVACRLRLPGRTVRRRIGAPPRGGAAPHPPAPGGAPGPPPRAPPVPLLRRHGAPRALPPAHRVPAPSPAPAAAARPRVIPPRRGWRALPGRRCLVAPRGRGVGGCRWARVPRGRAGRRVRCALLCPSEMVAPIPRRAGE